MKTNESMSKVRILATLLMLSVSYFMHAQSMSSPTVISLDPTNGSIHSTLSIDSLKQGDFFIIKINSINSDIYSIKINGKDTTLSTAVSFPTFASISISEIADLLANINPTTESIKNNLISPLSSNKGNFTTPLATATSDKINALVGLVEKRKASLLQLEAELRAQQKLIEMMRVEVIQFAAVNAQGLDNQCQSKLNLCDFITKQNELVTSLSANQLSVESESLTFQKSLNELEAGEIIAADKSIKEAIDKLNAANATLLSDYQKLSASIQGENYQKMLTVFSNHDLKSKKVTYTSLPIQITKEQKKVYISITPKDGTMGLPSWSAEYTFPGVSREYAAVGSSFYSSTLVDENYSIITTQNEDETSTSSLIKETEDDFEIGTAFMFRFGYLSENRKYGAHVAVGPGLSLSSQPKPRLLLGVGASAGSTHALALEVGLILGYANSLSRAYRTNTNYSEIVNPTISKMKSGGFLSIGYIYRF